MLKQLKEMGVKNITPFFYYQGGGVTSEQMGLLNGTILSGAMAHKFPTSGYNCKDFIPAEYPEVEEPAVPDTASSAPKQPAAEPENNN